MSQISSIGKFKRQIFQLNMTIQVTYYLKKNNLNTYIRFYSDLTHLKLSEQSKNQN